MSEDCAYLQLSLGTYLDDLSNEEPEVVDEFFNWVGKGVSTQQAPFPRLRNGNIKPFERWTKTERLTVADFFAEQYKHEVWDEELSELWKAVRQAYNFRISMSRYDGAFHTTWSEIKERLKK